jgi:glucokinase
MKTCVAGIDIGGTAIKFGLVQPDGTVVRQVAEPTPFARPDILVDRICGLVSQARQEFDISAVGIGCAGYVDPLAGIVRDADNLGLAEVRFKEILEERLKLPVRVDHDGQVALLAEWMLGSCRDRLHVVYVTLGTGVGGALLLDGRLYRGKDHSGAEIGHMITHAGGRTCTCGLQGCFEQYASVTALIRDLKAAYLSGGRPDAVLDLDGRSAFADIRQGDPDACRVFASYLDEVCIGLLSLMSLFGPEQIVIGGGLSNEGVFLEKHILDHLRGISTYRLYFSHIRVNLAQLGSQAGMIGAALLHFRH